MTINSTSEVGGCKPLRYHLRYHLLPGEHAEADARALTKFCGEHGIEEVVLFVASNEWSPGLLSEADETRWFNHLKTIKPIFEEQGISVSLNIWATTLHCDCGRTFPEDRPFKPMVSPLGETSHACASFADPAWQAYLSNLYGHFAELGFRVSWVEDDFRFHNHTPLTWGGGFEPGVLKRFSEKIGQEVTREEVLENILKPGVPHPWRVQWMAVWREVQLEVAGKLARSVADHAPGKSKLGLMSSIPGTHSVEGRDWRRLFETLTIEGAVAHRPHYAGYSDGVGRDLTYSIMMLDIQRTLRPDHCEVAPEVENWPFSRWSKADTQTWAEMACCMFYGSDALLMDLFPFAGNRPEETPGPEIGALLDRARPGLEWIGKHFSKEMRTQGVGTPWREDAQAHVRTEKGRSLTELDASSFGPGHFLLPYGIPVSAEEQEVNALFGNLAWAFSDEEIRGLLSGGLFLDGVGARILCRRGFGPDIGVEATEIVAADTNPYSAERTVSDRTGIRRDFYFDLCQLPSLALVEPLPDAVEWTTIIGPRGQRIGAGMVAFENKLGGRVVTYAPVDPVCVPRACQYQTLYQRAIDFLSGGKFDGATVVGGGVYLLPIHFSGDGKQTVVVFNGSPDPAAPVVRLTCASETPRRATVLAPLHKPVGIEVDVRKEKDYLIVTCPHPVPYMGFLVLEW